MNLTEFRKTSRLVRGATKISDMPIYREMMRVLWAEHPLHSPIARKVGVRDDDSAYQLGTIDGATRILQVLQTMTTPFKEGTELKPTYEPPEEE